MSTNESLVQEIQAGNTGKMIVLWERVERLIRWKAWRVVAAIGESSFSSGAELRICTNAAILPWWLLWLPTGRRTARSLPGSCSA